MKSNDYYGTEKIVKILLSIAPPVMLAQLIQALYNIVDSLFVGRYSQSGLTALSIIYPIQLLMIALSVGTGVGINTSIAHYLGIQKSEKAKMVASLATPLALLLWILFALIFFFVMPFYARVSTNSTQIIQDIISYGRIVSVFSVGLFLESVYSKILQAYGDMKTPMFAQIVGAIVNIILDPILIFTLNLGVTGAAIATVIGQIIACLVVIKKAYVHSAKLKDNFDEIKRIYKFGIPNIIMQSAYTFYILGLNLILSTFSDQAVTALGLFYKWQTFFFIPLGSLQTCMVPIVSYNWAANNYGRCKETLKISLLIGIGLMCVGMACFELLPVQLLSFFSDDSQVIQIGVHGFHLIGSSFIPMVTSLIFPVFFQAIGSALKSSLLTLTRTVICFVPLGFIFSRFGLYYFWFTFPVTEIVSTSLGFYFYKHLMVQ